MRRQTAAEARTKQLKKQTVWWGLQQDNDPRKTGDSTSSGIRRNTELVNWIPKGDRMITRRQMYKGNENTVTVPNYNSLSIIATNNDAIMAAFLQWTGSSYTIQITMQDTLLSNPYIVFTIPVTLGSLTYSEVEAKWLNISRDKLLLTTNIADTPMILVYADDGEAFGYGYKTLENDDVGVIDSVTSTVPNSTSAYAFNIAYSLVAEETDGTIVHQTPLQTVTNASASFRNLRSDYAWGTGGYSLKIALTLPVGEFTDYTRIRVWRTLNYSTDTGDPVADAAAGSSDLYYMLMDVDIADLATTELWVSTLTDSDIIGREQTILGYSGIPASVVTANSPGFFLSATGNRVYYCGIGATTTRIGQYYAASQYYDYEDAITTMTQSNGWLLVTSDRSSFRWDLITSSDAGVIGTGSTTIGVSIPLLGSPLQASGDFGVASTHKETMCIASNGYIIGYFSDNSVRQFDGATFSFDYMEGFIKTQALEYALTNDAIAGWLPSGEYILWLNNGITYSLFTPQGNLPHRWTTYNDTTDRNSDFKDWQRPTVKPIYLPYGNDFNDTNLNCLIILRNAEGTDANVRPKIWTFSDDYTGLASVAPHIVTFGQITSNDWWKYIQPEESHLYYDSRLGTPTFEAELLDENGTIVDTTSVVTNSSQVTLYPSLANLQQAFSIRWTSTDGDIVLSKIDSIVESIDKNTFPALPTYSASIPSNILNPLFHAYSGDDPLMTVGGSTTNTNYGLFLGVNCTVDNTFTTTSNAYISDLDSPFGLHWSITADEFYDDYFPIQYLKAKNAGNKGALSSTVKTRGLFLQNATLSSDVVTYGTHTGTTENPINIGSFSIGFWHKRLASSAHTFTTYSVFSLGNNLQLKAHKVDANTERFYIGDSTQTWGVWDTTFTDTATPFIDTWRYYVLTCTQTEVSEGVYDETYSLYRAEVGDLNMTLIGTTTLNSQANEGEGVFWWKDNDINIYGEAETTVWDLGIYESTTYSELWTYKGTNTYYDVVYNNLNIGNGN